MKRTISIRGGRVVDPASGLDTIADVHIVKRKIAAIGDAPPGFEACHDIDATGQIVCPGLVDLSVHLREPGKTHKATIDSETRAAACNGITTLCCPPDTSPILDNAAVAELLQRRAKQLNLCRVEMLAALTLGLEGKHLAEMGTLKRAGCTGVSNALAPVPNTEVLRNAYAYAASHKLTVFIQPRDPWLGREGCAHEGRISTRLGLRGIPASAETIGMARDLLLLEMTGARGHFCRLSTAGAVDMLHAAQQRGLPVTADVCAHQLFLSEVDISDYNSQCHVYPPLRSERDREALRQAVKAGIVEAICSDHQPHEADAKLLPFALAEAGISALDTLLPLSLRVAEETGMALRDLLARLTCQPAAILGSKAGTFKVGGRADLCIFDPKPYWTVTPQTMHSLRSNTPFLGWEMKGRVTHTLLGGRVVYMHSAEESRLLHNEDF